MDGRVYSIEDVHVEALEVTEGAVPAISISVRGWVNSTGWTHPRLAAWIYIDTPDDGVLDLDFIATAPTGYVNFVMSRISVGSALAVPGWVRGVRIHSSTNSVEAMLDGPIGKGVALPPGQGMPLPWPFPWQAPSAMR